MHCGDGADQLPPGALQPARVAARALSGTTSSAYNNMSTSLAVHSQLAQSEGPKVLQTKWQPLLLSTLSARCVHSGWQRAQSSLSEIDLTGSLRLWTRRRRRLHARSRARELLFSRRLCPASAALLCQPVAFGSLRLQIWQSFTINIQFGRWKTTSFTIRVRFVVFQEQYYAAADMIVCIPLHQLPRVSSLFLYGDSKL